MTPQDLKQIGDLIDIKLDNHDQKLESKFDKWKSEIIDAVDTMAKEIIDQRDFRSITTQQIVDSRERIDHLEKKVFGAVVG